MKKPKIVPLVLALEDFARYHLGRGRELVQRRLMGLKCCISSG